MIKDRLSKYLLSHGGTVNENSQIARTSPTPRPTVRPQKAPFEIRLVKFWTTIVINLY